jgi:hypothetical protein
MTRETEFTKIKTKFHKLLLLIIIIFVTKQLVSDFKKKN